MFRKTMLGGFKEDDVLNYIREMHLRMTHMEQELEKAKNQLTQQEVKCTQLESEYNEKSESFSALSEEYSILSEQFESDKEDYERLKSLEVETLLMRQQYDDAIESINEKLENARADAEGIVKFAHEKANEIQHQAVKVQSEVASSLKSASDSIVSFKSKTDEILSEFKQENQSNSSSHSSFVSENNLEIADNENTSLELAEEVEQEISNQFDDSLEALIHITEDTLPEIVEVSADLSYLESDYPMEEESTYTSEQNPYSISEDYNALEEAIGGDEELMKIISNLRAFGAEKDNDK